MVRRLNDGGQSMNILSYFSNTPFFSAFKISFNTNALFESFAVSTSKPEKIKCYPIKSKF